MKISIAALLAFTAVFVAACKKLDHCPKPPEPQVCDLMQSLVYISDRWPGDGVEDGGMFSAFRKEYDSATGKVRKVVTGLYTLQLYDSISMLVTYSGNSVYFLRETAPEDTIAIATFDGANRLQRIEGFPNSLSILLTVQFTYGAGRLRSYQVFSDGFGYDPFNLSYDAAGNIVRMYRHGETDTRIGMFFTYDLSVAATRQWYPDHFAESGISNSVYLAQFMGWLPDLEPVNKRTSYKIIYDDKDDDLPPYEVSGGVLQNHIYDSDGKLLSHNNYTSIWKCDAQKSNAPN